MPTFDVDKEGHKFPFNACEMLISDNGLVTERFFEETEVEVDSDEEKEEDESKEEEKQSEGKNEEKKEEEKKEEVKEEEKKEETKEENTEQKEKVTKKDETNVETPKEEAKPEENSKKEEETPTEAHNEQTKETNDNTKNEEEHKESTEVPSSEEEKKEEPIDNEEEEDSEQNPDAKTKTQYYNIDYFFQFLDRPTDNTNSVLLGYFFKILYHLIQLDSKTMISYIFDPSRKDLAKKLIKILTTKSSIESIKCLLTESSNIIPNYYELRKNFCMDLLTELNECNDNDDKCETISNIFKSSLASKPFFNYIMSDDTFLILLFSIPLKYTEQPWNLQYVLKLLIEINENVLKMFPKRVTPTLTVETFDFSSYNFDMKYALEEDRAMSIKEKEENDLNTNLEYLFNSLKKSDFEFLSGLDIYDDSTFDSTYQKPQKKLGIARLTQVEYFRSILDILVNANSLNVLQDEINDIIKLANEKKIFWNLIEMFYAYEFNNMYQTIFRQIITIILNENSPEILVKSFFIDNGNEKFIPLLVKHCYESTKSSIVQQPTNSGFFATEVKLLSDISNSSNKFVKEIVKEDQDLNVFVSVFAEQINSLFNQKLLSSDNNDISSLYNQSEEYTPKQKTLDQIIEQNKEIFKVYKEGGDYKTLLNQKKEEEQKLKEANEKEEANKLASSIPLEENSQEENEEETGKGLKGSHFFEEEENEEPKTQSLKDSHFFGDLNENPKAEDDEEEEEKDDEKYNNTLYWSTPIPTYNSDDIMKELSEL